MSRVSTAVHAISVIPAMALVACGGGDGGQPAAPTNTASTAPQTANVAAVFADVFRSSRSYSMAGTASDGSAVTASVSIAPGAQAQANGQTYDSATISIAMFRGGALVASSISTLWLAPGTSQIVYSFKSDGSCFIAMAHGVLPSSAALGQAGAYVSGSKYSGCSPSNLPRTFWTESAAVTQTWSYRQIAGVAFVCLDSSERSIVGSATESDCFEVSDASGAIGARARLTQTDLSGRTTTLAN